MIVGTIAGIMLMTQINPTILRECLKILEPYEIIYLGLVGSRYWKTEVESSDWDFFCIVEVDKDCFKSYKNNQLNIHLWGCRNFKNALSKSNPLAWEWLNYSQPVQGQLPDLNHLADTSLLLSRIKHNTQQEFSNQTLSYKQSNWQKRYEGFIQQLTQQVQYGQHQNP
nr:MAG TPA: putative nucleotidyltransferase [Caudoviricetes sp.]